MSGHEPLRLFTLEEARELVPRLRVLLTALQSETRQLEAETQALDELTPAMRTNGHAHDAAHREARIQELLEAIRGRVREIVGLGVEIKDINSGLVDFPSLRDDRVVYLCWRVDEPTVGYWHELEAGFLGRQPLDG